jgi:hypothetical protein
MPQYRCPIVFEGEKPTFIETSDPHDAQTASAVFAVQWRYVHNSASPHELAAYRDVWIAGKRVETDPDALDEWARRGEFDLAEVYRELFS